MANQDWSRGLQILGLLMQQPEMIRQARERKKLADMQKEEKLAKLRANIQPASANITNPQFALKPSDKTFGAFAPMQQPSYSAPEFGQRLMGQLNMPAQEQRPSDFRPFDEIKQDPNALAQYFGGMKNASTVYDAMQGQGFVPPTPAAQGQQTNDEFWRDIYFKYKNTPPEKQNIQTKIFGPIAEKRMNTQDKPSDVGIMQNRILSQMRSLYGIEWDANVIPLEEKIDKVNKHGRALYPDTWQDMTVDDLINADIAPEDASLFNAE